MALMDQNLSSPTNVFVYQELHMGKYVCLLFLIYHYDELCAKVVAWLGDFDHW